MLGITQVNAIGRARCLAMKPFLGGDSMTRVGARIAHCDTYARSDAPR
jgi:hypothetical protein